MVVLCETNVLSLISQRLNIVFGGAYSVQLNMALSALTEPDLPRTTTAAGACEPACYLGELIVLLCPECTVFFWQSLFFLTLEKKIQNISYVHIPTKLSFGLVVYPSQLFQSIQFTCKQDLPFLFVSPHSSLFLISNFMRG